MENEIDVKVSDGNRSIYLRMAITKVSNEFFEGGDIFSGANTFSVSTLAPGNYEGKIQDIPILPGRGDQMGERLTPDGQFALRSEL